MASLPGSGGGEAAAAGSSGGLLPLATSPSLAGFAQQAPLSAPVQLPLNLSSLHSQLLMPLGGGGAAGGGQPLDAYFPLALQHQQQQAQQQAQQVQHMQQHYLQQHRQQVPGGSGVAGQLTHLALPFPPGGGGGGGTLAGLPLNWPIPGDASGATVQVVQLPPCSSGILAVPPGDLFGQQPGQGPNFANQQQQQQHPGQQQHGQQQQQQQQQQAALSAPQIMSNTDHNGSTEGTQAWGGGGARRGSGRGGGAARSPVEADESGAAESRLKTAPSGRRGRGGAEPARKSRFR